MKDVSYQTLSEVSHSSTSPCTVWSVKSSQMSLFTSLKTRSLLILLQSTNVAKEVCRLSRQNLLSFIPHLTFSSQASRARRAELVCCSHTGHLCDSFSPNYSFKSSLYSSFDGLYPSKMSPASVHHNSFFYSNATSLQKLHHIISARLSYSSRARATVHLLQAFAERNTFLFMCNNSLWHLFLINIAGNIFPSRNTGSRTEF